MAIVEDYRIGNTRIIINDEFCRNQTEESKNKILKNVTKIVSVNLREQAYQTSRI